MGRRASARGLSTARRGVMRSHDLLTDGHGDDPGVVCPTLSTSVPFLRACVLEWHLDPRPAMPRREATHPIAECIARRTAVQRRLDSSIGSRIPFMSYHARDSEDPGRAVRSPFPTQILAPSPIFAPRSGCAIAMTLSDNVDCALPRARRSPPSSRDLALFSHFAPPPPPPPRGAASLASVTPLQLHSLHSSPSLRFRHS